jgi:flagellar protein FlgJ
MSSAPVAPAYYADFNGMEALRNSAQQNQPAAVREAARQFESLFTNMLLKSMREASMGESLGDSEQTRFYQDMFDQQLALQMSRGKGLGLAEHLVGQLQRASAATGLPAGTASAAAAPATGAPATAAPATAPVGALSGHMDSGLARRAQFISGIQPYAAEAARRLGVAPETIIAHAALETGWGQHLPAGVGGTSHNLFGIKAGGRWQGASADALTTEYQGDVAGSARAPFRAYDSVGASMQDYVGLLSGNPRYAGALNCGDDVTAFAAGLQRGGYATDPAYVHKLVATCASVREAAAQAGLKAGAAPPITTGGGTI